MFDIGFLELMVIAIVGLFVIGPERLPTTIRTIALWVGRIKRNLLETRREIEQQLGADDIRRELHNEQVMREWEKMKDVRKQLESQINNWDQTPLQDSQNNTIHDSHAVEPAAADHAPATVAPEQSEPASDIKK